MRAAGFENVFTPDAIAFAPFDGAYHARLAAWCEAHFPRFLTWDPWLAWPRGGPVPWPPLQDLLVAALARLGGGGTDAVERVLAWTPAVLGAATTLPVYAAARSVAHRCVALGAAALYAGFGTPVLTARVGGSDHHALVAWLGASWLACVLAALREERGAARLAAIGVGLALARTALLLAWNGSLLYLVVLDGTLLVAGAVSGRPRLLAMHAAGLVASALAVAPIALAWDVRVGGAWSAVALSPLHIAVLLAGGACAGGLAALERARPAHGPAGRLVRLAALGGAAAAAGLALPGTWAALREAAAFLTLADATGAATVEQFPLLPIPGGRRPFVAPELQFGWFAWAIPLAPLGPLLVARQHRRAPAFALAAITAVFAALTLSQSRYGNDLAAPGAVGLAIGIALLAARLPLPPPATTMVVVAACAAALAPGLRLPAARAKASALYLLGRGERLPATPDGTLVGFAHRVRAATPEAGDLLGTAPPDYGVLAPHNLGHAIRYHARRPVPIDNFWGYVDGEHFAFASGVAELRDEAAVRAAAERLRVRYLVTTAVPPGNPDSVAQRLQADDGAARAGRARIEHFRLVTEAPAGGVPFGQLFGTRVQGGAVYKLFEIVAGAVLVVPAPAGAAVDARLDLVTPSQRRFTHVASGRAGADGIARVRVPYATDASGPTRAVGPWRVGVGGREARIAVSDEHVREGAEVVVPLPVTPGPRERE